MQRTLWIYLALFVALITLVAVPIYIYNRPLGPPLELELPPPAEAAEPAQAQPAKLVAPIKQSDDASQTDCGGSGQINILYIGQNLPGTPQRGADVIRLMFINYDTPSAANLALPPDLLVNTAGLDEIDRTTLTLAFWKGKQPPPQGQPAALKKATEVVAQALQDDFDFTTEKYVTMNQPIFSQMIDTLGGIMVDVGSPVSRSGTLGPFEAGLQEMDSQTALDYVRILEPGTQVGVELARFNRQNEVVQGIYDGLLDPDTILKLPSLIGDFYHLLVTDLQPKELRSLHCMLTEHEVEIRYEEVNGDLITGTGPDGELEPDAAAISALIDELENWIPEGSE